MKKPDEVKLFNELRRLTLEAQARGGVRESAATVFPLDVATALGIHPNRAAYIFEKWTPRLYDYGVNVCFGWLTEEALQSEEALFRS